MAIRKARRAAYNGHFASACYHPLFLFNRDGDVEQAKLRTGNVASADDWRSVLEPVIDRYRELDTPKFFRADAAFAIPDLYELLEAEAIATPFGSRPIRSCQATSGTC